MSRILVAQTIETLLTKARYVVTLDSPFFSGSVFNYLIITYKGVPDGLVFADDGRCWLSCGYKYP